MAIFTKPSRCFLTLMISFVLFDPSAASQPSSTALDIYLIDVEGGEATLVV